MITTKWNRDVSLCVPPLGKKDRIIAADPLVKPFGAYPCRTVLRHTEHGKLVVHTQVFTVLNWSRVARATTDEAKKIKFGGSAFVCGDYFAKKDTDKAGVKFAERVARLFGINFGGQ